MVCVCVRAVCYPQEEKATIQGQVKSLEETKRNLERMNEQEREVRQLPLVQSRFGPLLALLLLCMNISNMQSLDG